MEKRLQDSNKDRQETPMEKRLRIQELYRSHGILSTINTSLKGQILVTFVKSPPKEQTDEAETHFRYLNRKKNS